MDRIEHSTHVRALIFSVVEISTVMANIDGETVQMQRTEGSNLWTAPWNPKSGEEGTVRIDVDTKTGNASSVHHYKTSYNSIKSSSVSLIFLSNDRDRPDATTRRNDDFFSSQLQEHLFYPLTFVFILQLPFG